MVTMRFLTVFALIMIAACGSEPPQKDEPFEAASSSSPDARPANDQASTTPATLRDFSALPVPYSEADYALGRRTFKFCGSCHTLKEDGPDLVGPNLYGIIGREAGSRPGFAYSTALEEASFAWTPEKLEEWLNNPRTFLPGNNMTFAGVHRQDARHAVIAYIMLETGYNEYLEAEAADTP